MNAHVSEQQRFRLLVCRVIMSTVRVCRVPSKPLTVSQKSRTTSCSSSDETSDADDDSDESNTSDDDENDVSVAEQLPPATLDRVMEPAEDSAQQVSHS